MRPRLVFTTDLNGTVTPENTFSALMEDEAGKIAMISLMADYTTGRRKFSDVLPEMERLAKGIPREQVVCYAKKMPFFPEALETIAWLADSDDVDALVAYSTTGFAGLVAILSALRHGAKVKVAASPVLLDLLTEKERALLIRPILEEQDKARVLDDLCKMHDPAPGLVFHVGDTLGDLPGIIRAAELGGLGIAFCPNAELRREISGLSAELRKNVRIVEPDPKTGPDYGKVGELMAERVREMAGVEALV